MANFKICRTDTAAAAGGGRLDDGLLAMDRLRSNCQFIAPICLSATAMHNTPACRP